MINSEWLRSFVAFAETLNLTHAAARLHISQPALHVQLRKLGESLGAPLYTRQGRGLALTAEGRKVLAFGREQEERTGRLLDDVRGVHRDEGVVLAAGEGTFLNLLSEPLRAFQSGKYGQLRVLTRDRDRALEAVQLGEAHLAVTGPRRRSRREGGQQDTTRQERVTSDAPRPRFEVRGAGSDRLDLVVN